MKGITMGSYCSQLKPNNKNSHLPPPDLASLLLNYEKGLSDSKHWLHNFRQTLQASDQRTEQLWRVNLLDFVLLAREGIRTTLDNTDIILALQVHLGEGGVGVSDYSLRESLAEDLDKLMEASQGAKGTRAVLSGAGPSRSHVVSRLTAVLLDPSVNKTLENEYYRYLRSNPSSPTLAVLLSIL